MAAQSSSALTMRTDCLSAAHMDAVARQTGVLQRPSTMTGRLVLALVPRGRHGRRTCRHGARRSPGRLPRVLNVCTHARGPFCKPGFATRGQRSTPVQPGRRQPCGRLGPACPLRTAPAVPAQNRGTTPVLAPAGAPHQLEPHGTWCGLTTAVA